MRKPTTTNNRLKTNDPTPRNTHHHQPMAHHHEHPNPHPRRNTPQHTRPNQTTRKNRKPTPTQKINPTLQNHHRHPHHNHNHPPLHHLETLTMTPWCDEQDHYNIPIPNNHINKPEEYTEPTINIDQETAEELTHLLQEKFPNATVKPDAQSLRHFTRQNKLHRIIQKTQHEYRTTMTKPKHTYKPNLQTQPTNTTRKNQPRQNKQPHLHTPQPNTHPQQQTTLPPLLHHHHNRKQNTMIRQDTETHNTKDALRKSKIHLAKKRIN